MTVSFRAARTVGLEIQSARTVGREIIGLEKRSTKALGLQIHGLSRSRLEKGDTKALGLVNSRPKPNQGGKRRHEDTRLSLIDI